MGRRAGVRCASRATSTRKRRYGPLARSTQTRALRINGRSIPSTHLSRRAHTPPRVLTEHVKFLWTGGALPWNFTTAHLQRERGIQDGDTTGNAGRSLRGGSENEREGERSYSFARFVAYGQLENVKDGICRVHWLFEEHGIMNLTGEEFIQTLGSLCGAESHGSLIDITGTGRRKERHSWHQDSGLERFTVMLGFPPESGWEGVGVFSHSCKLSHPLRQDGDEGTIIQWEDFDMGDLPLEVIGRPEYREGHEVMIYCDATHIHSAPDETNRESVWRFM